MDKLGQPSFRAKQLYEWMHLKLVKSYDDMTNLPKNLRKEIGYKYSFVLLEKVQSLHSKQGDTVKYLFKLPDDNIIETVLMKYKHGNTVCISSQVGCRMGCAFCASTIGGKERDLLASEMLEQIYRIQSMTRERISNIVVMGAGEPFDNYDNLIRFLRIITSEQGINISARSITVSTCGIPNRIRDFAKEGIPITLALSLHAPNDELRKQIMPIARKYDLDTIMDSCEYYFNETGRRLTFEYCLVDGFNDDTKHAEDLIQLIKGFNCHVNLIPINPIKEKEFRSSIGRKIHNFKKVLEKNRISVTIRREMGDDIDAACGQLRKSYLDDGPIHRGN